MTAFDSNKYKEASRMGFDIAQGVTPSVIAIARQLDIKPDAFAKALADEEANSQYRADISTALQNLAVKMAVADTAKNAVSSLKKMLGLKG